MLATRFALLLLLPLLLLGGCAPLRSSSRVEPAPDVLVENVRGGAVTPLRRGSALLLEIRSDTGIGSADVRLPPGDMPRDLVLRLHLKGLENFTFATPDGPTVTLSVGNDDPHVRQTLRAPGATADEPIDRTHPWWISTGIVSEQPEGAPLIPLLDGFFDLSVPRAFLEGDARAFSVAWVDFYR